MKTFTSALVFTSWVAASSVALAEPAGRGSSVGPVVPADPVASYETALPNETPRTMPPLEKHLLVQYMDSPRSLRDALALASYHVSRFYVGRPSRAAGAAVQRARHGIYAQYFLQRAEKLGASGTWLSWTLKDIDRRLDDMFPTHAPLDFSEGNAAHQAFIEAFNYEEKNRYYAAELVLRDLLEHPTNLLTSTYASAVHVWNGGEALYDDPGILYDYLIGSYLGKRAEELAQRSEREWEQAPDTRELFRLGVAISGFTLQSRRWIAKFHGDQAAVDAIDAETAEWLPKVPTFYMFPASVYAFTEPAKVAGGFAAFLTGLDQCQKSPTVFCKDPPRATYNSISFFLYGFDYYMKMGDVESAMFMLSLRTVPSFKYDTWSTGHAAWEHRENNLSKIQELYQNGDPADDPINGFLKRHKWGPESSTCQTCHQVAGATWSEEEKAVVESLPMAERYIGDWPKSRVAWHGEIE